MASKLVLDNQSWSEDFEKFKRTFNTNNELFKVLKDIARAKEIKLNNSDIDNDKSYLNNRIKAEIARNIWGMSRYYEIILEYDNQFQESLLFFNEALELASFNQELSNQK